MLAIFQKLKIIVFDFNKYCLMLRRIINQTHIFKPPPIFKSKPAYNINSIGTIRSFLTNNNFGSNSNKEKAKELDASQLKTSDIIDSHYGLKEFIKKTYLWTGTGITSSLAIGLVASNIEGIATMSQGMFGIGAILSIAGAVGVGFGKYTVHKQIITTDKSSGVINRRTNLVEVLYSSNSTLRKLSYGSLIVGNGIIMTPLFLVYPQAILPALIASSSVFGGATFYAMRKKSGELDHMEPILYGGLFGLAGVSLLGLGSQIFFGQNWFGDIVHMTSLYGGVPLFTGLIAIDTHKAVQKYNLGEPDHLGCSTELYLDFINLFIRFVQIIAKIQKSSDSDK